MFRDLPVLFSLLFFFAFIIYFFIAIFILDRNHKAPLNWTFCAACIALSVWTFSFAMANNAETYEQCLFWRRVAAIGWVSVHSIILHSVLILTQITRLIRKWWFLILFYLPAAFNIYIFFAIQQNCKRAV